MNSTPEKFGPFCLRTGLGCGTYVLATIALETVALILVPPEIKFLAAGAIFVCSVLILPVFERD